MKERQSVRTQSSVLETKVLELASRFRRIVEAYIPYPPKKIPVRVPFSENDVLTITFHEPIETRYEIDVDVQGIPGDSINLYFHQYKFVLDRIDMEFAGGRILSVDYYVHSENAERRVATPTMSTAGVVDSWELSRLFTPSALRAFRSAEVSSVRGLAERWLAEIISSVEEISNLEAFNNIDVRDLLDQTKKVGVYATFFDPMKDVDMITIHTDEGRKTVGITIHFNPSGFCDIVVGPRRKLRVDASSKDVESKIEKVVRSLPNDLMDAVERALTEYLSAFKLASVLLSYVALF